MNSSSCFICQSQTFKEGIPGYRQCLGCGHEERVTPAPVKFLINEALNEKVIRNVDGRDRFQISVVLKTATERVMIWDIGCGPGRFLNHIRENFQGHLGIEVTPECIEFAREILNLNVKTELNGDESAPSYVTFWHSLEHLPVESLEVLLGQIQQKLAPQGRLLISVPSVSGGHRAFKKFSVYYDLENHLHQFSEKSLVLLLDRFGFEPLSAHTGLFYSFFGWLLSFLNLLSSKHNFLYYELRRGSGSKFRKLLWAGVYGILALPFIGPALVMYGFELCFPRRGAVLTLVFARKV